MEKGITPLLFFYSYVLIYSSERSVFSSIGFYTFFESFSEGPKLATRGGVNGSRSKFLSKSIRRPISRKSSQALEPRMRE